MEFILGRVNFMAVLSVPIKLDKERNLRFGFAAMMALEKELKGKSFFEISKEMQEKPTITLLIHLVWAGLIHEEKTLTPEKVAKILDNSDFEDLLGKVNEAVGLSQKQVDNQGNAEAGEVKE
jgi:hypothetical protein